MKANHAYNVLKDYSGDELYQKISALYQSETDERIKRRSHGNPPSRNTIEGVIAEMLPWMQKACTNLPMSDESVKRIIETETGRTWVRYDMTDPRVEEYMKRTRFEMLKGTPLPGVAALTPDRLNAVSSMMLAQMRNAAIEYFDGKTSEDVLDDFEKRGLLPDHLRKKDL